MQLQLDYYLYMSTKHSNHSTDCRIAIFLPAIHPAMDAIEKSFAATIKKTANNCLFTTYNANGNQTLLHAQAEEMVQSDYNLIFTVGTTCTQTVYELCKKKQKNTPVVFSAVDNPDKIGIVHSLASSHNNMTGVISDPEYEKQLDYLFMLRPTTKQVLLAYDPSQGVAKQEEKKIIEHIIQKHGAALTGVEIYQPQEIAQKVAPFMNTIDAILILKDHAVVAGVESLISLCNKYGVTLYVSDQHSAEKDAALAFDITEADYGSRAADQALVILQHHKKPTDIPTYCIKDQHLYINTKTMKLQGLSPEKLDDVMSKGGLLI